MDLNVFGEPLVAFCSDPLTGFYRDGYCRTNEQDAGQHTVCAVMTTEFLFFSVSRGNDLVSPRPEMMFPGLKSGDKWCLNVLRWKEAYDHEVAPPVILTACAEEALDYVDISMLIEHAYDGE
ncbi:DUF2237 family protein [Reichenbachiella versicolor]|uniref:DUF2237 family protein n=1 Tax=Reichenbachiella versicolor TaxID=1821036 RepID=UPI000D6E9B60|nr:DUF2237 domain-containing protein [Reichenbachiella versicolor]